MKLFKKLVLGLFVAFSGFTLIASQKYSTNEPYSTSNLSLEQRLMIRNLLEAVYQRCLKTELKSFCEGSIYNSRIKIVEHLQEREKEKDHLDSFLESGKVELFLLKDLFQTDEKKQYFSFFNKFKKS